jgi:flavodoxin
MKKVLVAYDSETGKTKQMAEYIAEGIRSSGHDAHVKRLNEMKTEKELKAMMRISSVPLPTTWT